VLAALVMFLGIPSIVSMPTDIFPEINIPVVTIVWQYTGLSTPEMEERVTTYRQFALSSSVNGIRDIEAQTLECDRDLFGSALEIMHRIASPEARMATGKRLAKQTARKGR
jgi:hypothetical protein